MRTFFLQCPWVRVFISLIVFGYASLFCVQAQTTKTLKKSKIDRMMQVYGYCIGQQVTLDRIMQMFPQYEKEIKLAEYKFNSSFGIGVEKISNHLREILNYQLDTIDGRMRNQLMELHLQEIDEDAAIDFINEINNRAEGDIPSPMLETLLSANFEDFPHKEFTSGMTRVYKTKGHSKSKGTDWQVKVPLSWKSQEGDRPNIIQKFVSDYGDGDCMISLMVYETGYSNIEAKQIVSDEENMKAEFARAGEVINYKQMIIDNYPGGMIELEQMVERLDIKVKVRIQQYFALKDGKMYVLHGAVASIYPEENHDIASEIAKHSSLFRLVANSIIINDQYTQ